MFAILCVICFSAQGKSDLKCLAETVYHESRGESFRGRLAVAQVVVNRVRMKPWPNSICKVVFQKNQFSWTRHWKTWNHDHSSLAVARLVLLQPEHPLMYFKATYFHSGYYPKSWPRLTYIKTIGKHHFYK